MCKSILIVGHGYLGGHLSKLLSSDTFEISATTRSLRRLKELEAQGISGIQFDVLDQQAVPIAQRFDAVVYCIGFDKNQNATRMETYEGGLSRFLDKLESPPGKLIYVSSTGVYGQTDGQTVNEDSETEPTREGGLACLAAEKTLRRRWNAEGLIRSVTILRLAGIYGPDRIPNRTRLEKGSISMQSDGFLNLVHVFDAARVCRHFLMQEENGSSLEVFNVSDGQPPTRGEFYAYLASKLGLEWPKLNESKESQSIGALPTSQSRREGSKRIDNSKLVTETDFEFQFKNFREGLDSILGTSQTPD